jgi:hypothetical protein
MSIHPVMTNEEIVYILEAIEQVATHYSEWKEDYQYNEQTNEYSHKSFKETLENLVDDWYQL